MSTEQMQTAGSENLRRITRAEIEILYRDLDKAAERLEELSMDFGVGAQVMRFDPSQGIRKLGERHAAPTAKELEETARRVRNLAKTGLEQLGKATGQPGRLKSLSANANGGFFGKLRENRMPALFAALAVAALVIFVIY